MTLQEEYIRSLAQIIETIINALAQHTEAIKILYEKINLLQEYITKDTSNDDKKVIKV